MFSGYGLVYDANNRPAVPIDSSMFNLCQSVHFGNLIGQACRQKLFNSIFDSGPEFYWNRQPIQPRYEFMQIVRKYWIEFCKNAIDWIMIAGIVPIAFEKVDKNLIPIVPKGRITIDYNIQMVNKGGRVIYQYVKLKSRKTGEKISPRVDKKVFIRSGFGWDPTETGKLKSIVSSIINTDYFQNMITQYTLRAEFNRSDPELVTEISNETLNLKIPEYDHFGDWDRNQFQQESQYRLNQQEVMAIMEQQRQLYVNTPAPTMNALGEPVIDRYKKQSSDNVRPLPINHKLVRQNMPEARTDWVQMNKHIEGLICTAYMVPRNYLVADEGMSETSVKLTQDTFAKTVTFWKTILSDMLTDVYNALYYEDDIKNAMGVYSDVELNDMSEEQLFDKTKDPRVTIGFSLVPTDSSDGLLQKFALGMIDWPNFQQMALLMGGYPSHLMNHNTKNKKNQDPWDQDYKLNMVRTGNQAALAKLGAAGSIIFPQQKPMQAGQAGEQPKQPKAPEKKRKPEEDKEDEKDKQKKKKQKDEKKTRD